MRHPEITVDLGKSLREIQIVLRSRLTERLNLVYPVISAPMAFAAGGRLAGGRIAAGGHRPARAPRHDRGDER
jgi:hypothetical protein